MNLSMFASVGTQTPDANFLLQLLLAAVLIGNVVAIWLSVINRRAMQKREVSFSFEPASKDDFLKHLARNQQEHDQLFSKIGGVERGLGHKVEALDDEWHKMIESKFSAMIALDHQSRQKIHDRINDLDQKVAGTKAAVDIQTGQIARLDKKLDDMPDRIFATLRNTKP